MGGTRGSGFVSCADNMLDMSVVRGVRGVGGVCERIGFGLYQSCRSKGSVGRVSVFGWFGPGSGRVGWGGVMSVCVVILASLWRWQVQVSVHCARCIPAHLRCTQCSILLYLIDVGFLTCICLWQMSQIPTFLGVVVGPGLVSTSPAFMRSSACHPAYPHGRLIKKKM